MISASVFCATLARRPREHGNVNEDNCDGCFRFWEIRRSGVSEKTLKNLQASEAPKLQAAKAKVEVIGLVIGKWLVDSRGEMVAV